jgi:heme-degrading monooxygenase HmoA
MYIRLNMFSVGSGKPWEVEQLADRFAPIFRAQRGFKSVTLFEADAAAGEYGSFSFWDTREDAEAADAALMPQLQQAMGEAGLQMRGTPIRRIGEGYDPKA